MTKRKRQHAQKNSREDLNDLAIQAAMTLTALAERGLSLAKDAAKKRKLTKEYPYLDQAFSNIQDVLTFFSSALKIKEPGRGGNERKRRKTDNKKISK